MVPAVVRHLALLLPALALGSSTARAVVLSGSSETIRLCTTPAEPELCDIATVFVQLQPGAGELASHFEGNLLFVGTAAVSAIPSVLGDSVIDAWDSATEQLAASSVFLSLTSENLPDARPIAEFSVFGAQPGRFELRLGAGAIVSRAIDELPFTEDLPLSTPEGALLAVVDVVPEPGTALLLGAGLVGLGIRRRRARRPSAMPASGRSTWPPGASTGPGRR